MHAVATSWKILLLLQLCLPHLQGKHPCKAWGNCMLQVQHGEGKLIPLAAMLLPQVLD